MTAPDMANTPDNAPPKCASDIPQLMGDLLLRGAARFDAVGFRVIESMVRRSHQYHGEVKRQIDHKILQALTAFRRRFDIAQSECRAQVKQLCQQHPLEADAAQQLFDAGDFAAVRQLRHRLQHREGFTALATLSNLLQTNTQALIDDDSTAPLTFESMLRLQEQQALSAFGGVNVASGDSARLGELKSMRLFKSTWAQLSTDKRVANVIEQAPKEAGPLNSQTLVIRSLSMMREISPEYLSRFVAYADTLLWLEKAGGKSEPAADKPATAKTKSKPTSRRSS